MTQNMGDHLLPRCLGAGAAVEEGLGPALHIGIGQRVGSAVLPATGTHRVPAGFGQMDAQHHELSSEQCYWRPGMLCKNPVV